MVPTEFTDDERAFLPEHEAVTFAKDQPEYLPLPAVVLEGDLARTISKWQLTDAERASIAAGECVYLEQLRFVDPATGRPNPLQPIRPTVGLRAYCPRDEM